MPEHCAPKYFDKEREELWVLCIVSVATRRTKDPPLSGWSAHLDRVGQAHIICVPCPAPQERLARGCFP